MTRLIEEASRGRKFSGFTNLVMSSTHGPSFSGTAAKIVDTVQVIATARRGCGQRVDFLRKIANYIIDPDVRSPHHSTHR